MQKFLNTLWEFTRGKEDKDNFIQKAIKVCKVFKVKPLKTRRPNVPSKRTARNLFCKDIRITKKELQDVPVYKASAIISKEWKKVKASEKKMKYKDLYEEGKQRHEEALQRYQQDQKDEIEISLHKRCNKKAMKVSQPKKASRSPRSDEPKKASGLIDDPSEKEQKPKKASSDGKKITTKVGKKVKKTSQPKKHQSHLNLLTQTRKKKGCLRTIKGKKCLLCWG